MNLTKSRRNFSGFSDFFSSKIANNTTMDSGENFDRNKIVNFFALFVENLSLYTQSLVRQNRHLFKKLMEDFQLGELFDTFSDKLAEHPPLKFLVVSMALSCAIPVVMFILFGITSVIITFAGFLLVEGALLAMGGLCTFICILTMVLVLSMMGIMLGVFYILGLRLKDILNKCGTPSNSFENLSSSVAEEPAT